MARTHRSFELAAVQTYAVLLNDTGLLDSEGVDMRLPKPIDYDESTQTTLDLLLARHQTHAEDLVPVVSAAGGAPVSEANNGVLEGLLGAVLPSLTTERSVLQFSLQVETIGAATYAWGAGTMSTASLRQSLMAVGAIAGRQAALPSLLLEPDGSSAVPAGQLDTSAPARIPEHMLLDEDSDGGDVPAVKPDPAAEGAADVAGEGAGEEGDTKSGEPSGG